MNKLLAFYAKNKMRPRAFDAVRNSEGESTIYLYDTIVSDDEEAAWWGGVSPMAFIRALDELNGADVTLRINSPGGSVFGGQAIAAAMREYAGKINVKVDSLAASAASIVAITGDTVQMAPGSFMMIHKAWTIALGNSQDFLDAAALLEKIDGSLAKQYALRTGIDIADVADMMAAETWLDHEEAVSKGFADSVIESPVKANNRWDLSVFDRAPKMEHEMEIAHLLRKQRLCEKS